MTTLVTLETVDLFGRLETEIWPMPRISTTVEPLAGATEEDLNRELDNPAEDWDQVVPHPALPRAATGEDPLPATGEVGCPHCGESNEAGSACKRCGK
ncbi:hypothetical protein [Streptomyces sp. NPDC059122]|uniref:hypothetical protein n=1 Tax=Streptomyces sp. NPDC059122 TaxID=3346732 RepID=UPI003685E055